MNDLIGTILFDNDLFYNTRENYMNIDLTTNDFLSLNSIFDFYVDIYLI